MTIDVGARADELNAEASSAINNSAIKGHRVAGATLGMSLVQGLCLWAIAIGTSKLAFALGALGLAGAASFLHSDPVRIPLMTLAGVGATATLLVTWNQQRLRNLPSARWRRKPLTTAERKKIGFAVAASVLSYGLLIGEFLAHRYLHQ